MATKINPDFYGAEDTFVNNSGTTYAKHSAYSLGDLMSSGKYTGGSLDTTATPWGIGKSSLSSDYWAFLTKGAEWTFNHGENERKNSPLYLYYAFPSVAGSGSSEQFEGADANSYNFTSGCYKNRIYPDVEYDNGRFKSTLDIDDNDTISLFNSEAVNPITYADYQHLRAYVGNITYIPTEGSSLQTTTLPNLLNGTTTNISKIVRVNWGVIDTDNHNSYINFSVGGSETDIPELFKQCYYGDETKWVRPCRFIYNIGLWTSDWYIFNTGDCSYTSSFETVTSFNIVYPYRRTTAWGSASETEQVFDDVVYKWVYGFCKNNSASIQSWSTPIETGELYDATSLYGGVVYLDCGEDATPQDYAKAILHEIAFLGLPFITQRTDYAKSIGDNDVYLPVFDEHMVTTGEYIAGSDSLTLPNAQWGDVFGSEMPEYDPEYEPDEPIPVEDYGDTTNIGSLRIRIPSDLKVYLMDESTLHQMLYKLNNYYTDKTPDDWTIDFQGVNPSDYILGCYVTRLNLPPSSVGEAVKVGVIDLNLSAYTLNQVYDYWCTIDFGTRTIQPRYNDFRDYAPYTSVELYLPLAGTVDLDVNYCMGHDITVKYYYDVLTMSCVAAVYRDNMLYKCSDCKIGAEIPLLSSNMGSYQNQIEQLSVARQRNNIAIATSATAAIAGTTAAIATGSPMAIIGAAGGFSKLAGNISDSISLDYQFDHIAPSVSVTGAADAQNNLCVGQLIPKLIIKRPVMLSGHNDTVYSKTVGNACCINDYIGSRTGLVVCSNINANDIVNAYGESPTVDEINAIKQAFSTGVYV